jgi:hypothetical protein
MIEKDVMVSFSFNVRLWRLHFSIWLDPAKTLNGSQVRCFRQRIASGWIAKLMFYRLSIWFSYIRKASQ